MSTDCTAGENEPVEDPRRLIILYGSQTGTAQEVAEMIWRESKWFHFHGPIMPMDEYAIEKLIHDHLILFVCSTTGQGEEPDNMKRFWKFLLKKNLPSNSLERLTFGVLGLGDSSYTRFNFAAKKLHARLVQLGGTPLLGVGLADDQHDLGASAAIDPWLANVWHRLSGLHPMPSDLPPLDRNALPTPRWLVTVAEPSNNNEEFPSIADITNNEDRSSTKIFQSPTKTDKVAAKTFEIRLKKNTRTTNTNHFQDVRLLEFDTFGLEYKPGDVLSVRPQNSPQNIERLLEIFSKNKVCKLTPAMVVTVTETTHEMPVPLELQCPVTVRECAERHWDLNGVPKRFFFELMAHFTTSDLERDKLKEFTTPLGQNELYNYANRPRRTVVEVLEDFWQAAQNIPPQYLFEVFSPIRPRSFSIASSPRTHRNEVHILVARVSYKTSLLEPRIGLCSNWLASLEEGSTITATVFSGSFKFPLDQETPVVMVGPGTGVAPFRSYIHERAARGMASADKLILFFGCRNEAMDYHCKDEWLQLVDRGLLTLFCAFSRDSENKIYVQHKIGEQTALLWDAVSLRGGHIYVAGNSKNMPTAVRDAFIDDVFVKKGMLAQEASDVIKRFEHSRRYQCETWS